ncbi:uncharacterized protein [Diadema antillarum]|uniref:uncharacterized protein n=1 Tax=Diadema antillarum TaxID=105358 RepID=UPI003A8C85DB
MAAAHDDPSNKDLSNKTSTTSDFQYDEDKHDRVFMMSQADEVREKVLKRHLKHRLPRKPGMYELPTRRRSVQTNGKRFYHGHHWDVGGNASSRNEGADAIDLEPSCSPPVNFEHTTRRLTIQAVDEAVDVEQLRRIQTESRDQERARSVLSPVNKELKSLVHKSKKEEKKTEKKNIKKVEETKNMVMEEMLHKKHLKELQGEEEEERQRRMRRMEELTDDDKSSADKHLLSEVKAMSNTAKVWCNVRQELEGAFHDLEEVHDEVDHAVDDLYQDLRDDFVLSFKRTTHRMKLHVLEETERRRRLNLMKSLSEGDEVVDPVHQRSLEAKDSVHEELLRTFALVKLAEDEEEETSRERAKLLMVDALDEMLHAIKIKAVDDACAEERKRRIREAEKESRDPRVNPAKERMRDAVRLVQEQMLLQKFNGKKMNQEKARHVFPADGVTITHNLTSRGAS